MNATMGYEVRTERFNGPLDVLLNLIEERKLLVSDISLAAIVDEFVAYSRQTPQVTRAEEAEFLAVASTLILIKSRSLLPSLELTDEEEQSIEELERRLEALREFRRLAKNFSVHASGGGLFARDAFRGYEFGFWPPHGLSADALARLSSGIIESLPRPAALPSRSLAHVISIEEKTRDILNRIGERVQGSLISIVGGGDAVETIVGFLAVLELIKQGLFAAEQTKPFGDVDLKRLS